MKSIIIFQEQNYLFALDFRQFETHFILDEMWITPSKKSKELWNYQNNKKNITGQFIHFGHLLGFCPAIFNYDGAIFLKTYDDGCQYGLYINNFIAQIPINKISSKYSELDAGTRLPEQVSPKLFSQVFKFKRRTVLLINPVQIYKKYLLNEMHPEASFLSK